VFRTGLIFGDRRRNTREALRRRGFFGLALVALTTRGLRAAQPAELTINATAVTEGDSEAAAAFCEEHAKLIRELIGAEMPERRQVSQSLYRELDLPGQRVMCNGSGHEIESEMIDDLVKFFRANSGNGFVPIPPHEYPFVEARHILGPALTVCWRSGRYPGAREAVLLQYACFGQVVL